MKRVDIYIVYDEPRNGDGDYFNKTPTFDRDEAIGMANYKWNHLTEREHKLRHVYIGIHRLNIPDDDNRTAEQIWDDLADECLVMPDIDETIELF